jgi:hypothetical protein
MPRNKLPVAINFLKYDLCGGGLWLESPLTFLHCCHEARLKKIALLPPPNEKHICVVQVLGILS